MSSATSARGASTSNTMRPRWTSPTAGTRGSAADVTWPAAYFSLARAVGSKRGELLGGTEPDRSIRGHVEVPERRASRRYAAGGSPSSRESPHAGGSARYPSGPRAASPLRATPAILAQRALGAYSGDRDRSVQAI